jgi:Tol biopolymer transport system component/DNA-binding winged helix-turn-helix (wHTH) protein
MSLVQPTPVSPKAIRFGLFEADLSAGELRKRGRKVPLPDQPFKVLALLLRNAGQVVPREELQRALWPDDTFGDFDEGLNKAIQKLRQALDDSSNDPRFIETLPRKGYRFIAPVDRTAAKALPIRVDGNAVGPSDGALAKRRRTEVPAWVLLGVVSAALVVLAGVYFRVIRPASRPMPKTVPVTSYPGQQITPALSPDGKQVAFAWDGEQGGNFDIYVKLVDAGTPLRLTSSPAFEYAPAWSPDGRYIAFCRDVSDYSEIWTIPALGGAERKLGQVAKGAGNPTQMSERGGLPVCGLSWSPDGESLAIVDRASPQGVSGIYLLSVASGEKRKMTSAPDGYLGDCVPTFSPDGQAVAFIRIVDGSDIGDVYVLPITQGRPKGNPRRVTFDGRWVFGLDWTGDGRHLVFSSNRSGGHSLWMVSAAGGMPQPLAVAGENATTLSVSRTGHRLTYAHEVAHSSIWRIPGPNSTEKKSPPTKFIASKQLDAAPKYSPDGRAILFYSARSGDLEIWLCDSEGRNPAQLTSFGGAGVGCARWSPDSRWIAFNSMKDGNTDLYVISVEGGRVRRLTTEASKEWRPSWSKDGRWIYFASDRTGDAQIWKMPAQGGAAVQVTKRGGDDAIESVDGDSVYYAKLDTFGIWRAPVAGGEETQILDQGRAGGWALTSQGICFRVGPPHNGSTGPAIKFYAFGNHQVTTIRQFGREVRMMNSSNNPLSISPDGRWILYAQMDHAGSDLMLVENFR